MNFTEENEGNEGRRFACGGEGVKRFKGGALTRRRYRGLERKLLSQRGTDGSSVAFRTEL
jgi:hypothetical protein